MTSRDFEFKVIDPFYFALLLDLKLKIFQLMNTLERGAGGQSRNQLISEQLISTQRQRWVFTFGMYVKIAYLALLNK